MKTLYRCFFPLAATAGETSALEPAARAVVTWSDRPHDGDLPATLERLDYESQARPATSEALYAKDEAGQAWAYRFEKADSHDEQVTWVTDVGIAQDEGLCLFSLTLYLADRSGSLRPLRRFATRPRIVPELLRAFPAPGGLQAEAKILTQEDRDVEAFLAELRDPDRLYPIVLVSVDNYDQKPAADAERLADRLAGLAVIYEMQDKFAGWKLNNRLERGITPMDGAVRVFWPGWQPHHQSFLHPVYPRFRIQEFRRREQGFAGYLLDLLARHTSHAAPHDYPSWTHVASRHHRLRIDEAREAGNRDELVELLDNDNQRLTSENNSLELHKGDLEFQVLRLQEELEKLHVETAQWRTAYQDARAGRDVKDDELPEAPPESLKEACLRVERDHGQRIAFALNSRSDADYGYESPDEVLQALEWLAGSYYRWRSGDRPGSNYKDLDLELREICGWHYSPSQSDITTGRYADWYATLFENRRIDIHEHIGRGDTKRQGNRSVRFGFSWDEQTKKVVIGFIGQHQKSGQS